MTNTRNRKVKYAIGEVIGNWTVVAAFKHEIKVPARSFNRTDFVCRCVCGKEAILRGDVLAKGYRVSCGCIKKSHGLASRGAKHPVYLAWQGMMTRCYNPHRVQWKDYGGRGIGVAASWHNPKQFIADMLPSWKSGLTLDRKDNDKDYSASNCRWATQIEQQRNKRNSVLVDTPEGKLCMTEAARKYGVVSLSAISWRIRQGWDAQAALFTPDGRRKTSKA